MFHLDPNSRLANAVLIIGLPLFTFFLWYELRSLLHSLRSRGWPTAAGVITESRVERHKDVHGIPYSSAKIRYAYAIGGWNYENNAVALSPVRGHLTWGYADRIVQKYPIGKNVDVFHNPDNPSESCLEPGVFGWEDFLAIFISIVGICFGMKQLGEVLRWLIMKRTPVVVN
jgi:hypothetical protein